MYLHLDWGLYLYFFYFPEMIHGKKQMLMDWLIIGSEHVMIWKHGKDQDSKVVHILYTLYSSRQLLPTSKRSPQDQSRNSKKSRGEYVGDGDHGVDHGPRAV